MAAINIFSAPPFFHRIALLFAVAAMLLAAACGGGGGATAGGLDTRTPSDTRLLPDNMERPEPTATRCDDACRSDVSEYNNGEALVLSPANKLAATSFGSGPADERRQTGTDVSSALAFDEVFAASSDDDDMDLEENEFSIEVQGDYPGVLEGRVAVFCTEDDSGACNDDLGGRNYALGYSVNLREPSLETPDLADDDIIGLAGFTFLKTTLSNDFLAFGVAVELRASIENNVRRYRPERFGGLVFGQPATTLPTQGLAAYAGFSQAYARSDNRGVTPFTPAGSNGGGIIANGFSAMVFSFNSNGEASFMHGFIDLNGRAFIDNGLDSTDIPDTLDDQLITQHHHLRANMTLSANFADPGYRSPSFVTAAATVTTSIPQADGYERNRYRDYFFDPDNSRSSDHASGLFFRLADNDQTPDTMDFTMELASFAGANAPRCLSHADGAQVRCFANTRPDGRPGGAGVVALYGGAAPLNADSGNANNVPIFAGGVWQYDELLYVDVGPDGVLGGGDDTLLAEVDLYGSFGGHVVDQPAQ